MAIRTMVIAMCAAAAPHGGRTSVRTDAIVALAALDGTATCSGESRSTWRRPSP